MTQSMQKPIARALIIALVLGPVARADQTVYVSQLATSPIYADLRIGTANVLGQNGTMGNPFGSVQAAYAYLFNQSGNHTIRLLADGGGTYGGDDIGQNEFANGNGYIRMVSDNNRNVFPTGGPSWNTVKLMSDDPLNRVTLRMSYPSSEFATDGITSPAEGTNAYPASYTQRTSNSNNNAARDRGQVIRGLWNPGTLMPLPGMIVENLDIVLGGGHVLVGTTAQDTVNTLKQEFTFNNVNLTMEREMFPAPNVTGNPIWGKSALFVTHAPENTNGGAASLSGSYMSFNNSTINLINNDLSPWTGDFYVGAGWGGGTSGSHYKFPENFVTGNNTSTFNYWDGTEYVQWTATNAPSDLNGNGIWQGGRNGPSPFNSVLVYENGVGTNNTFFNLASFNAAAADFSWLSGAGGSGTWAATGGTNWSGGPWNAAETGKFAGTPGTVTVAEGGVAANNGLEFAVGGYTLTGAAVTLGGANAAANTITTLAGTTTIDAPLAGSAGLTKAGAGGLVLAGANTFSGGLTVSAGTLSVGADANLGNAAGGITLGGGTLELTTSFTLGSDRTITAVADTTSTIAVTSGTVSYGGAFTGSGNLDKAGAGTLSVSNASSGYTGLFTISAGTLEVTGQNAFANATLSQTGGTLLLAPVGGGDVIIPDLDGSGGTTTVAENVTAVVGGSGNSSYNGQIRGQGSLRKEGAGILTLNADNDFAGTTRIAEGRLKLGAGGALSATPLIEIDLGGIFDVADVTGGFSLATGQRLGGRGTVLGDVTFTSGSELVFDPSGPLLIGSGTISFAEGFGIANIFGLDMDTVVGIYTLLNETTGGDISFANLANVGSDDPFDIGGGKLAYFQRGSLEIVVVPEPATALLGGLGIAIAAWCVRRRRRGRLNP